MKAIVLRETGGPQNLRVEDVPIPEPQTGETLVRVRAAALNHREVFITQGRYPDIQLPRVLGADGCGEAARKRVVIDPTIGWGDDERVWQPHARILGMPRDGTFAQYVCVPNENVYRTPDHLSDEEAAALPLAGVTAFRALFARGELREGETVLVTGIGGGVQSFVLLFAKACGARVAVTSGSDEKLARAQALGADAVVNYRTDPDWHKTLGKSIGPVDLAVDSAGGESLARALAIVRRGGRAVTYGATSGNVDLRMFQVFWHQLDIRGTSMGSPADFQKMLHFTDKYRIKPVIDRVFEMQDVVAAAERMDHAEQFGKIVLRIP